MRFLAMTPRSCKFLKAQLILADVYNYLHAYTTYTVLFFLDVFCHHPTLVHYCIHIYTLYYNTGHEIKNLMLMHKHVIPNISADWEVVAAFLDYNIPTINLIKRAHRRLPRECCTELLQDWITTDNGVKPKTYEKFIEVLSQIGSLVMVTRQIKQCLCQEGVLGGDFCITVSG